MAGLVCLVGDSAPCSVEAVEDLAAVPVADQDSSAEEWEAWAADLEARVEVRVYLAE